MSNFMKKLLLPYALDSSGQPIHINSALKNEHYKCPSCGAELSLRISKIPEGCKYHKTNHFAHKGCVDNHCSESFLHKLFKIRTIEYLREKLESKSPIWFEWDCDKCYEVHKGNLTKKATSVVEEFDLQICRPDIALLDKDNKVIIVIEIVVTHKPTQETLQFYNDNKIACLQINVNDFADCDCIEKKIIRPDSVNLCPRPICKKCGHPKNSAKLVVVKDFCWHCGNEMKIALIFSDNNHHWISTTSFTKKEIKIAQTLGVNIQKRYSQTTRSSYWANVCNHCNAFIGDFYMHDYLYNTHEEEIDLEDRCFYCHHND